MGVVLELPAVLSRYSDGKTAVSVDSGSVASVLEELWLMYPQLQRRVMNKNSELFPYLLLFHNGQKLARKNLTETSVADGDTLEIVALAEGG